MATTYTEHNRSRNMEATLGGNHKNMVYPSCIGYYIYQTMSIWLGSSSGSVTVK